MHVTSPVDVILDDSRGFRRRQPDQGEDLKVAILNIAFNLRLQDLLQLVSVEELAADSDKVKEIDDAFLAEVGK